MTGRRGTAIVTAMLRTLPLAGALALAALAPATASAAFGPLAPVPFASSYAMDGTAAVDASGRVTAAGVEVLSQAPPVTRLRLGSRAPGGSFAVEREVATTSGVLPYGVDLDVAPDGGAVACVTAASAAQTPRYLVLTRAPGASAWSEPETLSTSLVGSVADGRCAVAAASGGRAALVLTKTLPTESTNVDHRRQLTLYVRTPGAGWKGTNVSPTNRDAEDAAVALLPGGGVTVAFAERIAGGATASYADDLHAIRVRSADEQLDAVGAAHTAVDPADVALSGRLPRLAVAADGRAVLAFQTFGGTESTTLAAQRAPGGAWGTAVRLSEDGGKSSVQDLVAGPSGEVALAYRQDGPSGVGDAVLVRRMEGGAWSGPVELAGGLATPAAQLAYAGGDVHGLVTGGSGGAHVLRSVELGVPGAADVAPAQAASFGDVDLDGPGTGWLVASVFDGDAQALRLASAYEQAPAAAAPAPAGPGSVPVPVPPRGGGPVASVRRPAKMKVRPVRATLARPVCARRLSRAACRRHRVRASSWRTLSGTAAGGTGALRVEVAVTRHVRGRTMSVLGARGFRIGRFDRSSFRRVALRGGTWTQPLPVLRPGRYVIKVKVSDRSGRWHQLTRRVRLRSR